MKTAGTIFAAMPFPASNQMESIQTYCNPEPDIIRCKSSIKEFDETGRPMSLQKSISYKNKIAQYAPWDFDRGEDLRNLFAQYLMTHGLQHLIAGQRKMGITPENILWKHNARIAARLKPSKNEI